MRKLAKLLLVLFLALTSCASMMSDEEKKEVLPYQENFVFHSQGQYTLDQVQNVPIFITEYRKFDKKKRKWVDNNGTVGTCYPIGVITLNKKWWYSNYDQRKREQLIFHELGHCLLKTPHTSPTSSEGLGGAIEKVLFDLDLLKSEPNLSDGCPPSYMHPTLFEIVYKDYVTYETINCLDKHYEYYMDELFDRTTREEYENGYQLSD